MMTYHTLWYLLFYDFTTNQTIWWTTDPEMAYESGDNALRLTYNNIGNGALSNGKLFYPNSDLSELWFYDLNDPPSGTFSLPPRWNFSGDRGIYFWWALPFGVGCITSVVLTIKMKLKGKSPSV